MHLRYLHVISRCFHVITGSVFVKLGDLSSGQRNFVYVNERSFHVITRYFLVIIRCFHNFSRNYEITRIRDFFSCNDGIFYRNSMKNNLLSSLRGQKQKHIQIVHTHTSIGKRKLLVCRKKRTEVIHEDLCCYALQKMGGLL